MIERLLNAIKLDEDWSKKGFIAFVSQLREPLVKATVDWDGPEEIWASVLLNNSQIMILSYLYPLAIVLSEFESSLPKFPENVEVIIVDDFDTEFVDVDSEVLAAAFPKHALDRLKSLNRNTVSVSELWWATIT